MEDFFSNKRFLFRIYMQYLIPVHGMTGIWYLGNGQKVRKGLEYLRGQQKFGAEEGGSRNLC